MGLHLETGIDLVDDPLTYPVRTSMSDAWTEELIKKIEDLKHDLDRIRQLSAHLDRQDLLSDSDHEAFMRCVAIIELEILHLESDLAMDRLIAGSDQ